MQNTENREKALVYAILKHAENSGIKGFSQALIDAALRKGGIALPQDDIDDACSVLTLAGIIHQADQKYYFTSPVFTKVLQQSYDLEYLFRKVKEEGV
jgi:hypothetical protein